MPIFCFLFASFLEATVLLVEQKVSSHTHHLDDVLYCIFHRTTIQTRRGNKERERERDTHTEKDRERERKKERERDRKTKTKQKGKRKNINK
jgi:hypothetical protein